MSDSRQTPRRRTKIFKWTAITVFSITAIIALIVIFFPTSFLNRKIASRLTDMLVQQLGPDAVVTSVGLDWRTVELTGISLPLDQAGSRLDIHEIKVEIDLYDILTHLDHLERGIHSVVVDRPTLCLAIPSDSTTFDENKRILPRISVPPRLYATLARFDSMRAVRVQDGLLLIQSKDKRYPAIEGVNGRITQDEPGKIGLMATAHYLSDYQNTIALKGWTIPAEQRLELEAAFRLPHGRIPDFSDSLFWISSVSGLATVQISAFDSVADLRATMQIDSMDLRNPWEKLQVKHAHLRLDHDTVRVTDLALKTASFSGAFTGAIGLIGKGYLRVSGNAKVSNFSTLRKYVKGVPELEGIVDLGLDAEGHLPQPSIRVRATSPNLRVAQTEVSNLQIQASVQSDTLSVQDLSFSLHEGNCKLHGDVVLKPKPEIVAHGEFALSQPLSVLGWTSELKRIEVSSSGVIDDPTTLVDFVADSGRSLGQGVIRLQDDGIHATIQPAGFTKSTSVVANVQDGELAISAENVQYVLSSLFPDSIQSLLAPLSALRIAFSGNQHSGNITIQTEIRQDSTILWTQIAREFEFSGRYENPAESEYGFLGKWSGVSGFGDPFVGRADIVYRNDNIDINHFFIDDVGDVQGFVNTKEKSLDVSLNVQDLPFTRFPMKPAGLVKARLAGTFSGNFRICGPLSAPIWTTSLVMVNGAIFDVPDYWINVELEGAGYDMTIQRAELGRDVRRIVSAKGTVNFKTNTLFVEAESGSARAEDFVLALTGASNIISGEINGKATVSGMLTAPDISAEVNVSSGKLLGAISVDGFSAKGSIGQGSDGQTVIQVPEISFYKDKTYRFSAEGTTVPVRGGKLQAHIEGSGNFLNFVDQLDRNFHSKTSDGKFRMDFGGTFDKPVFLGGDLTLENGEFEYMDATPVTVSVAGSFHVSAQGAVEAGGLHFTSGDQSVDLRLLPETTALYAGLKPLIIPSPHLNLGIIEIETNENGMPFHIPGFMKPDWTGTFTVGSTAGRALTISGLGDDRLIFQGDVAMQNSRIVFPLVAAGQGPPSPVARWLLRRLEEAQWNVQLSLNSGNHYNVEITGLKDSQVFAPLKDAPFLSTLADYVDHLSIDALVNPTDRPLKIRETIADTSFYLQGRVTTNHGRVEYLDQTFSIDYAYADFDETNVRPVLEGRAKAYGADSLGQQQPVYLTIYQIDRETKIRQKRGRLDNVTFVLETETGAGAEEALHLLGYGTTPTSGKAEELVAATVARMIGRQWLEPIERRLEKWTWLDEVSLNPGAGRSPGFGRLQQVKVLTDSLKQSTALRFVTGSQVTVGKYLGSDLFITYTGELAEANSALEGSRLGFVHFWNLEYRIRPLSRDLVVDLAIEYDAVERKQDESVSLKYSFILEP